ncbi:MAG TPA: hypothetical protein VFW62_04145, partial [bacterium]|nr:hypothetical protein [bacterium]
MIWPLFLGGAALAYSACSDSEKEKSSATLRPFPILPTPSELKCPSRIREYSLKIEDSELEICHSDDNGDEIFQDNESLGIIDRDRYISYSDSDFEKLRAEKYLPNFVGLNLTDYLKRHQQIFPQGANLKAQERFTDLESFARQRKVSWNEAWDLAQKIPAAPSADNPGQVQDLNEYEKLDATTIAAMLLSHQNERDVFYLQNRKLIDETVL